MAIKCYVLDKYRGIFERSQLFGKPVEFDISVANTNVSGTINITSRGPGSAAVELKNNLKDNGVYRALYSPSVPGTYHIDIKWNEDHISGSPFAIKFSNKDRLLVGLDMTNENFQVGVLHQFKLNCDQVDKKDLVASIEPPTAATIEIPQIDEDINQLSIIPLEEGVHTISVLYGDGHLYGSPYTVTFKKGPNAQKCYMLSSDIGKGSRDQEQAMFVISTKEGGEGSLSAYVRCPGCINQVATIEEIEPSIYQVYFDIGVETEYSLVIEYGEKHIKGSPFKLVFEEAELISQCQAQGEGLHLSEIYKESTFIISAVEDKKLLSVTITSALDRSKHIEAAVNEIDSSTVEVKYCPTIPGIYKISVEWNEDDITGSPFEMRCCLPPNASSLNIVHPPREVFLGSPVSIRVKAATHFIRIKDVNMLTCVAQYHQTLIHGKVYQEDSNLYICSLDLLQAAKYKVRVTLNGADICGSPFKMIAMESPRPENCKACGPGIKDSHISQQGQFTIDTNGAGSGALNVRVHGPKKSFNLDMKLRKDDNRIVDVLYHPIHSGKYTITVTWAGSHIPGSPFNVTIHEGSML